MSDIARLVINQSSPENATRVAAELEFSKVVADDPSGAFYALLHVALDSDVSLDLRQACLLHIKRLVPKYWSIGFQSYVGPPISQDLKALARSQLLALATSSPESKLRSASSYAVVQIASVDYPDEWPDLLSSLYHTITNPESPTHIIGGLSVLNEVFDDLVLEEQFWEGGVGSEVIAHLTDLLARDIDTETSTCALRLYHTILGTLQSPEAFSSPSRKNIVFQHINAVLPLFDSLLHKRPSSNLIDLAALDNRRIIYDILAAIVASYNKKIPQDFKHSLLQHCLRDFDVSSTQFSLVKREQIPPSDIVPCANLDDDPSKTLANILREILQVVLLTQHSVKISEVADPRAFVANLVSAATLSNAQIEDYAADVNTYVTDITGLGLSTSVRDSASELLSEMNQDDAILIFESIRAQLESANDDILKEALLLLMEALFSNEDAQILPENVPVTSILNLLNAQICSDNSPLVIARCFLLLPRFFGKFVHKLSVSSFGTKTFMDMVQLASSHDSSFVKMSSLVSANFYKDITDLSAIGAHKNDTQLRIFQLVQSMIDESEEDGLPILLEGISVSINMDPAFASTAVIENGVNVMDLIFHVAFKDSSNIQLTIDASESLSYLMKSITPDTFLRCCEKSLPRIIALMDREIAKGTVDYTPDLYLSLQLLGIIVDSAPKDIPFPDDIFNYIITPLYRLLLGTLDNQILQSGGEVFNTLLKKAPALLLSYQPPNSSDSGMAALLHIVSKFLSPELSDSAALNCGITVALLLDQFRDHLSNVYLLQILEATVRRLVMAQSTPTIENLLMVFTKLIVQSPQEMVDFLSSSINISSPSTGIAHDGLHLVLPIWFESFTSTRGYHHRRMNAMALAHVFFLNDPRVSAMVVNGDIIPYSGDIIRTRSMAKSMPDQYTQIPAPLKIIKLMVEELDFEAHSISAAKGDTEVIDDDDDDEEWEDMDEIGIPNYSALKSYVTSDDEDDAEVVEDDSLHKILVQFFKECAAKNLGDFRTYYEMLSDEEKRQIAAAFD